MSFLLRWLFAFLLLSATYNPTPFNFVRLSMANWESSKSVIVLMGLILLVGYIIYLRATLRSIGAFGMILVLAVFAALLWVAADFGLIDLTDPGLATWIALFAGSVVLGIGLSWSIIRKRLSGQLDVDEVED
ncbi:DUF6524 family protein [Tropicibacter naphthalenivorans]|uniref:Uncharacterized protein n=1 Tax=Tropicibacter naphthalenivorans TaxID=441103 RepID=A0A0P1G3K2_9RHOB|nr:DUF6524 family protein [Tropicibacter naphthalenivorans]CUH76408.1 hypothetical protein TRN7648_00919 [Tropicibacter naphthalenivorans]SMC66276.1 hypothetical protein SAMN04488093_102700 [Tropicibacter naphthalenivorans]